MRSFLLVVVAVLSVGCQSKSPIAPSSVSSIVASAADQPSSSDRFAKDFTKAVKKAWGDPSGDLLTASRVMAKSTIASVTPRLQQPGTTIIPVPGANQIKVPLDATSARFTLNLALADKLAVGNSLSWAFEFSPDGVSNWFRTNAATWQSYGPDGYHDQINNVDNPDPYLDIPLVAHRGQFIRMIPTWDDQMTIGLTVTVN